MHSGIVAIMVDSTETMLIYWALSPEDSLNKSKFEIETKLIYYLIEWINIQGSKLTKQLPGSRIEQTLSL